LLLPAAALSGIILLPVYHRYYDATLLSLAIAWAIAMWSTRRNLAIVVLALLIPFCLPVGWQTTLSRRLSIDPAITGSLSWLAGVAAAQSWLVLLLAIVFVREMMRPTFHPALQSAEPGGD
jgi:hypothetical protein